MPIAWIGLWGLRGGGRGVGEGARGGLNRGFGLANAALTWRRPTERERFTQRVAMNGRSATGWSAGGRLGILIGVHRSFAIVRPFRRSGRLAARGISRRQPSNSRSRTPCSHSGAQRRSTPQVAYSGTADMASIHVGGLGRPIGAAGAFVVDGCFVPNSEIRSGSTYSHNRPVANVRERQLTVSQAAQPSMSRRSVAKHFC